MVVGTRWSGRGLALPLSDGKVGWSPGEDGWVGRGREGGREEGRWAVIDWGVEAAYMYILAISSCSPRAMVNKRV